MTFLIRLCSCGSHSHVHPTDSLFWSERSSPVRADVDRMVYLDWAGGLRERESVPGAVYIWYHLIDALSLVSVLAPCLGEAVCGVLHLSAPAEKSSALISHLWQHKELYWFIACLYPVRWGTQLESCGSCHSNLVRSAKLLILTAHVNDTWKLKEFFMQRWSLVYFVVLEYRFPFSSGLDRI